MFCRAASMSTLPQVPEPPEFSPAGLPTGVFRHADVPPELCPPRSAITDPPPVLSDGDVLLVCLHTFDVRDVHPHLIKTPDFDDLAVSEKALRAEERKRDRAVEARVDAHAEAHVEDKWAPDAAPPVSRCYITAQLPGGRKVGFVASFRPSCQVELPDGSTPFWYKRYIPGIARSVKLPPSAVGYAFHHSARFKGYVPKSVAQPCERKLFHFAQTSFPNVQAMKRAAKRLRDGVFRPGVYDGSQTKFNVYEDRIDPDQKLIDQFSLEPSSWHVVTGATLRTATTTGRELLVDYEYDVKASRMVPLDAVRHEALTKVVQPDDVPTLLIGVLDAEMNTGKPGRFPKSWREEDPVIVVSLVFAFAGTVPEVMKARGVTEYVEFERHAYVLSDVCEPKEGVVVHLFDDELEMIAAIRDELFVNKKVDILAGHNIVKFDIKYLTERVVRFGYGNVKRWMRFGALLTEQLDLQVKMLNSAAMGTNRLSLLNGVGFVYVDTLLLCKQYHKLRENSLKYAASQFLSEVDPDDPLRHRKVNKFDMPYDLIPVAAAGNGHDWRKLAAYCVQDSVLVLRLLARWDAVKDLVAQSRIITIPMAVNVKCGQQQRVRNTLMKKAHRKGMVLNGVNEYKDKAGGAAESAEGGWVLENVQGLHDIPVVVLDFASLYPSMQRNENLCWSTEDCGDVTPAHEANGLVVKTYPTATGTFRFVQNVPGVFPEQLTDLLAARKAFKGEMRRYPKGSPGYQNADNKQKATKIVMNAGYGTANCQYGIMPCLGVGTVTCNMGRQCNQRANAFCEQRFGTTTLYGDTDSIMVHFPEPPDVKRGTRKARLRYAMDMGMRAEKEINDMFNSDIVKVECEKVYYPFLSCAKKTYAGLKFEPDDIDACADDLRPKDVEAGIGGGNIEAKGIRTVRRDVPLFCRAMSDELLHALFFDHDLDKFWDIVHTYTERICFGEMTLDEFVETKELKDGYDKKAIVQGHVAVTYAKEYAVPGSAYEEGDRVPMVYVEEADPRRVVKPPWFSAAGGGEDMDDAWAGAVRGGVGGGVGCGGSAKPSRKYDADVNPKDAKRAMFARHPDEVRADPLNNHIDIVHYIDKGVGTVLKQLMPKEEPELARLIAYAKRVQASVKTFRMSATSTSLTRALGLDDQYEGRAAADAAAGPVAVDYARIRASLPPLSHRRPKRRMVRTLTGEVIEDPGKAKKRAATRRFAKDASASSRAHWKQATLC